MEYKKINDYTINCIVTKQDMENFGLNLDEIFNHTKKSDEFLHHIVDEAKEELGYDENFYMKDTREMYLNKGFTETEHNVFYADNVKDAYEFAYPFIRMMYSYDDVYGIWGAVKSCIINIGDFKLDLYEDMKYYYNQYTDGIYTYCANKWDPPVIVRRKLNDYRFDNEIEEYYKGNGKWEKFSIYNSRIINIYEDELVAIENKYELEEAIKCYDKR